MFEVVFCRPKVLDFNAFFGIIRRSCQAERCQHLSDKTTDLILTLFCFYCSYLLGDAMMKEHLEERHHQI